jgi:hypothetical protein
VLVADRFQALEVAHRRHQHAGDPGHRLHDHGGDRARIMQRQNAFQRVGAARRRAAGWPREKALRAMIMRVRQVVHAGQQGAELLAVVADAADGNAAEADAVIAALAADQAGALALAAGAMIGQRDLQRRVDRFGAGIAEEDVVQPVRQHARDAAGELERLRMAHLEHRRVSPSCRPGARWLRRCAGGNGRR